MTNIYHTTLHGGLACVDSKRKKLDKNQAAHINEGMKNNTV